jgi:hypothetical protein
MFCWIDTKFAVEGVVPNLFHIIPVRLHLVLNRVFENENLGFRTDFIANTNVLVLTFSRLADSSEGHEGIQEEK